MARANNQVARTATSETAPAESEATTLEVATTETAEATTETPAPAPAPAPDAPQVRDQSLFAGAPPPSPFAAKANKAQIASVNTAAGNEWAAGHCASCGAAVTGKDRYQAGRYLGCFYECSGCDKTATAHQEIVKR